MEENIHQKDNLDDFVQKSFDGYEELPSSDMWGRIEGALDAPSEAPHRPSLKSRWFGASYNRWWAAAAAVLLVVVGWAGIYTYYENKISALETSISKMPPVQQEKLSPQLDSLVAQKVEALMAAQQQTEDSSNQAPTSGAVLEKNDILEQKNNQNGAHPPADLPKNVTSNLSIVPKKYVTGSRLNDPKRLMPSETPVLQNNIKKSTIETNNPPDIAGQDRTTNQIITTTTNPANEGNAIMPGTTDIAANNSDVSQAGTTPTGVNNLTTAPMPASIQQTLNMLQNPKMMLLPLTLPTADIPTQLLPVIRPHRSGTGLYVGIRYAPVVNKENAAQQPSKPIERPNGGSFPRQNSVFVNDTNKISRSSEFGLVFGKKVNRHLAFESGISFMTIKQESVHQAKFQFRDGHPHSGPGGGHNGPRFNFNYNLNTYSGSAAVSLRMEQVDNGSQISQTEPLGVKITTKQRTEVLKIPLLAAVSLGKGRLHGVVKAGPEANFNISNQLEVDVLTSLNSKFKLEDDDKPHPVFETNRRFSLGYRASAGIEYQLLKNVSIAAEPVISGIFAQTDNLKQELPGIFTAGINFGLNYHF